MRKEEDEEEEKWSQLGKATEGKGEEEVDKPEQTGPSGGGLGGMGWLVESV